MAAGLGFKTFTTGEVLTAADTNGYLMQGVLVFASAAARDAAITSPQEGQFAYLKDTNVTYYYDGAAWVVSGATGDITAVTAGKGLTGGGASGDVTVSLATSAKGDLVVGTGTTTAAALTVGNNGETLVADSAATTGLRYQGTQAAGKNYLINGAMENWQRGTSSTSTSVYLADRWYQSIEGATAATISQSTSVVPTNFRYSMKMQRTAGNTGTGGIGIGQSLETTASIPLQSQTVVMSFWLKAGANFSAASGTVNTRIFTGTGTDQSMATAYGSWTGYAETSGTATATTTWTRYSVTATIPSGATQAGVRIFWTPVGTAGADDSLYITGIQMEIGSVATSFTRAGGTLQGELAACERYFQILSGGTGFASNTTTVNWGVNFRTQMRVAPSVAAQGTLQVTDTAADFTQSSASVVIVASRASTTGAQIDTGAFTGLTQYRPAIFISSGNKIQFSAEL